MLSSNLEKTLFSSCHIDNMPEPPKCVLRITEIDQLVCSALVLALKYMKAWAE